MDQSVLANLRPSSDVLEIHARLLHTYSQPIMKKGFSRSYTLTGPERIRPLLIKGVAQLGHAMPLKTRGCGSQYKKRCSEGVRAVEADAVNEKYVGEQGSQNVFRME